MSGVIVHEWLERHGGAEKVMKEVASLFPDAKIKSLWNDDPDSFSPGRVSETWLARTPLRSHKGLALPFMPATWRHLGDSDADWVLAVTHLFAHHARFSGPARDAPKYVYAYTPARYIWNPELDERGNSILARSASTMLRPLDRSRAQEPVAIAGISRFVSERIERAWNRESTVIYPPVEVDLFRKTSLEELSEPELMTLAALPDSYVFGASRFIPYKRLDLVIDLGVACDVHVVLAGDGPSMAFLKERAAKHPGQVTFIGRPSLPMLRELYRRAIAYVFPPIEDFGIMPVEAMATGAPVIASRIGGAAETVVDGQTGILLDDWSKESMRSALHSISSLSRENSIERAAVFDQPEFHKRMKAWVGSG